MQGDSSEWVSVSEAARRLGVTRAAIQNRVKRRTLETMTDNHGRPLVRVAVAGGVAVSAATLRKVAGATVAEPPQRAASATEAVPLPAHREIVEAIQRASSEALERQERQYQEQLERQRTDHAAEMARVQTMHLDLVGRLQAQAAMERSIWQERVDRAEILADEANAGLRLLVERIMALPEPAEPWWSRLRHWFGPSKRSDIKG